MTEKRQKLIDRFNAWLNTNPNKRIIAYECANIAEEYAEEEIKAITSTPCCKHKVKVLTKEEVEANRSSAYKYLDFKKKI